MNYKQIYDNWITDDYFDEDTKNQLLKIKNDEKEIEDRFYKNLEFGTGGLRGIIGVGTNRINKYTISKATQGFCDYILSQDDYTKDKGVVIGYDSRRMSQQFAKITALVLNANNIKTYLFDELRPTPMVSFAIRELNGIGGIVITASHNPAEYNGYKVYGADGGQVPFPKDKEIIKFVDNITDFKMIKTITEEQAIKDGLFNIIGSEIDEKYDQQVLLQSVNKLESDIKIVYTPLHGTGNKPIRRVLKKAGFKNVYIVKEQEMPDSEFSTVSSPNPENIEAFELAIKLADNVSADILVATDPDADRVGVMVKGDDGYVALTGNMIGVLLAEYILNARKQNNKITDKDTIISTIVSSNMSTEIAKSYGVHYMEVLTGFKFIGEKIKQFENGDNNFIFGFEESYGCLAGTYARDKDAVVTTMLICELAGYYAQKGLNLLDALGELYNKYGYYKESLKSITLKGIDGLKNINKIMDYLRKSCPTSINCQNIKEIRDYKLSKITNVKTMENIDIELPTSNVLYFVMVDNSWFCVRPSGTEPKIKIYFGVKENNEKDANNKLQSIEKSVLKIIDDIIEISN